MFSTNSKKKNCSIHLFSYYFVVKETHLKNNLRVLSVSVMPCCETLKCTVVGDGNGRRANNTDTALRTA